MAAVMDASVEEPDMEIITVVQKLSEVFSEELSDLQLEREIEFVIE